MPDPRTLDIYLDDKLRDSAMRGTHNYLRHVQLAFESRGYRVGFQPDTLTERLRSGSRPGYSLFHMHEPVHDRALTTRRAYFYPFWRIESTGRRWDWEIARSRFQPEAVDAEAAEGFANFWRKRLFGLHRVPQPEGFVLVPLQGLLTEHRSFQTMSPIDMLKTARARLPARRILVTLHPSERYSHEDLQALDGVLGADPLMQMDDRPASELLAACDMVVTENSSVALSGFFMHKPAVLFAQIDFHHIAASVGEQGVEAAFASVGECRPDFDRYLFWFLQEMSINAGRDNAEARILETVRRRGWDV